MPRFDNAICTSGLLPTSTTVSHGFIVTRYSSPPFGSNYQRLHSEPCPMDSGPVTAVKGIGDHWPPQRPQNQMNRLGSPLHLRKGEDWEQQGFSSPLSAVPFCVHSVSPPVRRALLVLGRMKADAWGASEYIDDCFFLCDLGWKSRFPVDACADG